MTVDPQPWKTQSSEYVHRDRFLSVRRDRVRLPNGQSIDAYPVIESPPWVTVVAVTDAAEIVLVRQYRHALGRVGLELPGGFADGNDPIEEGQRELLEETGYGGGEWQVLQTVAPNPAILNNWNHWLLAQGVTRAAAPSPDEMEDVVLDVRPASAIPELLASGEIFHALHVGALLRYWYESRRETLLDDAGSGAL